jgi:hypothetical protein
MSKSEPRQSEKAREQQESASVYDILYYDVRRIPSFLAQFDDSGHLQQIKRTDFVKRGSADKGTKSGGITAAILSGRIDVETSTDQEASETAERTYDPLWANALALLDFVNSRGKLEKDLAKARVGQFVLMDGALSVIDASMLTNIYSSKTQADWQVKITVDASVEQWRQDPKNVGLNTTQRAKAERAFRELATVNARSSLDIFTSFTFGPQFTIKKDGITVWSTLSPEGLVGTTEDIFLKHGVDIPGVWYALGMLDALPSPIAPLIDIPAIPAKEVQNLTSTVTNHSNMWRTRIGRPADAYGITTLLIFRPVG